MTVVQEMCARIGLVTGSGLASVIKKRYSRKVVFPIASLLLIANTINIGADIGSMAASIRLVFPQLPRIVATLSFTVFILFVEIIVPYKSYVKILKYLTLSLFAYIVTSIIVGGHWNQLVIASIVPHVEITPAFAMMLVAIFGTTISPYLFFWQASEEVEDIANHKKGDIGKGKQPHIAKKEIRLMRKDTAIGMAFSQIIMWAIITTTAGTLHIHGITDIQSADQAAKGIRAAGKNVSKCWRNIKNNFRFRYNWYGTFGHTCSSRFIWLCTIRCIWMESRSEQEIQAGQGILYDCGLFNNNRIMDKLY